MHYYVLDNNKKNLNILKREKIAFFNGLFFNENSKFLFIVVPFNNGLSIPEIRSTDCYFKDDNLTYLGDNINQFIKILKNEMKAFLNISTD